jgi:hypothetical protein
LIEIRLRKRKARRPDKLLLHLRVVRIETHGLAASEFVLRDQSAGKQFVDVQTAAISELTMTPLYQ